MTKTCQKCKVSYIDTAQTKCSYCGSVLKIIFSQGMCPNISLALMQDDMVGHSNLYFGWH